MYILFSVNTEIQLFWKTYIYMLVSVSKFIFSFRTDSFNQWAKKMIMKDIVFFLI